MSWLISSIGRAVANLKQSWLISSITVGIISICLFLVGGYLLMTHNLQGVLETWKQEVRVTVYLRGGFPEEDVLAFQDRLSSLPEVHSVTYISQEQALEEFAAMLGDNKVLVSGLETNPLPASLRITLRKENRNLEGVKAVLPMIGDDPLVQDIQYGKEWLGRLDRILNLLRLGSVVLGLALSLAAVFIISTTIKITVMARQDELEIMRMVGATEGFIRLPFLVEGIIQGFAGADISLGLLGAVHTFLATRTDQPLLRILHIESLQFLPPAALAAIITGGMLLGGLGSLASVGRHSR